MFNTIKTALETVPALKNKVIPLGLTITTVRPPVGAYSVTGPDPHRSISGKLCYYSMAFTVDILAKSFDECQQIYASAVEAAGTIADDVDRQVLRLECTCPDMDSAVPELDLMRKRLTISIDWR